MEGAGHQMLHRRTSGEKEAAPQKVTCQTRIQQMMASIRSKVEHLFPRIKVQFGYAKVRYRGIAKNANRLYLLSGFANLMRVRMQLVG